MKRNLREWIQEAAEDRGLIIDQKLENFIFYVASEWGERRIQVDRAVQAGTYKDEDFELPTSRE